jgi:hypothetical protein
MLGIYVNEMQRSVGFGNAGGYYRTRIVPYRHFAPYRPGAIAVDRRTHLGDVPNDFEASVDLQYIPVRQGWYYGQPVDGRGYPDRSNGFGQAPPTTPTTSTELDRIAKLERTQTILQIVSTISIAAIASLTIAKAVVSVRRRRFGLTAEED